MATTTPLATQIAGRLISTPTREINNEYRLELIAKNSETAQTQRAALLRGQHTLLRAQVEGAALNLRGQAEIARRQDCTNNLLGGLAGDMIALLGEAERMNEQLASIEDVLEVGFQRLNNTITQGFASVVGVLERSVAVMEQQQRTLVEIANLLSRPYETKAQELLREGQNWLETGEQTDGREKQENWKDALRLLQGVVDNEIGKQNYVAWFNIGYLRWKHLDNLVGAEEAFFHAQRLSAPNRDLWHTKSLRHMAEMQYGQNKFQDAYTTANRALVVQRDYPSLYNAARYAAKIGKRDEMVALLDECIEMQPTTIVTMFSEADFIE